MSILKTAGRCAAVNNIELANENTSNVQFEKGGKGLSFAMTY